MRRANRDEAGFTVLEVVVALIVFALISMAVIGILVQAQSTSRTDRLRVAAANVAEAQIEQWRDVPTSQIPVGQKTPFVVTGPDGTTYTVSENIEWVQESASKSSCDSASTGGLVYKRITESVTWPSLRSGAVRTDTLRAVNKSGLDPTLGAVSVKVVDQAGAPESGMSVNLSDAKTAGGTYTAGPVVTGEDGCAVFANVPPGTATVTTTLTGYVDRQGNLTATGSQGVTAAQLSSVELDYAKAATIALNPSVGSTPGTLGVSVGNPQLTTNPRIVRDCYTPTVCASGTGWPMSVVNLFPYTSGYQVWSGACTDAKPATPTTVSVTPGGTAAASVTTYPVTVVNGSAGAGTMYALHLIGPGCTNGEVISLGSVAKSASTVVSLPLGSWYLSFDGPTYHGPDSNATHIDQTVTISSSGASPASVTVTK